MSCTRIWLGTVFGFLALASSILPYGYSRPATDEAGSKEGGPVENTSSPTAKTKQPSNLQLVLEGPFAIQEHIPGQPGKIKILIPEAKNHFEPGFDADLNQQLLCQGNFSIDLGKHKPVAMSKRIPTESHAHSIEIDTVGVGSLPEPGPYITILVNSPDQIAPIAPTTVTEIGEKGGGEYASKILLRYKDIDPTMVKVDKITGGRTCDVSLNVYTPLVPKTFTYPWSPVFVPLGSDVRLLVSMVPSVKDDPDHSEAKSAYQAIAKMLGIQRKVEFPKRQTEAGPHNDCRAPQILVRPLETTK